jgi:hypothetical protein
VTASIDVLELRQWCDHICREPSTDPSTVVRRLGLAPASALASDMPPSPAGTPADGALVDLVPVDGLSQCSVRTSQGRFWELLVGFAEPSIERRTLEDAMGPGVLLRRTRALTPYRLAYRVVIPGAAYSCDLIAAFPAVPEPTSVTTAVTLRRGTALGPA